MTDHYSYQETFNYGSDARLAGVKVTDNPYPSYDLAQYRGWRDGWIDVDHSWGRWARWPVRRLPEVTR